jgi:hypothetical protein
LRFYLLRLLLFCTVQQRTDCCSDLISLLDVDWCSLPITFSLTPCWCISTNSSCLPWSYTAKGPSTELLVLPTSRSIIQSKLEEGKYPAAQEIVSFVVDYFPSMIYIDSQNHFNLRINTYRAVFPRVAVEMGTKS